MNWNRPQISASKILDEIKIGKATMFLVSEISQGAGWAGKRFLYSGSQMRGIDR